VARDSNPKETAVSIESDAQKDLALSDEDAAGIAGGKGSKKVAKKPATHPAATHTVGYIDVQGPATGGAVPWVDNGADCDPGDSDPADTIN
jgi:hypothetical protein